MILSNLGECIYRNGKILGAYMGNAFAAKVSKKTKYLLLHNEKSHSQAIWVVKDNLNPKCILNGVMHYSTENKCTNRF